MNRFVLEGLVRELNLGKTILVLTDNPRTFLNDVLRLTLDGSHRVYKGYTGYGNMCVECLNGGRIFFKDFNETASGKGMNVDIAYIDRTEISNALYGELLPCVGLRGEFIHR